MTSGIDVSNAEGAMMMVRIFAPDLIVNLLPPELALDAMNLAINAKADYIDATLYGVPDIPSPTSLLSKQFQLFAEFQNNCKTAVCGAGFVPGAVSTIIKRASDNDFSKIDTIDLLSVSGEKKSSGEGEGNNDDDILYSEDVKATKSFINIEPDKTVFYIKDGKIVEADAMSIEGKSAEGSTVYLDSSPMITDLIKEFPDIVNARYFKLGKKDPKEHKAPKEKLDLLRELGLLSEIPVRVGHAAVAPIDLVAAVLPKMQVDDSPEEEDTKPSGMASYEIYITGQSKKNEETVTRSYIIKGDNEQIFEKYNVSAFEYMKGSALISGVKLMCRDKWKKPGVFTPAAFDCETYFNALSMEGIKVTEGEGKPF